MDETDEIQYTTMVNLGEFLQRVRKMQAEIDEILRKDGPQLGDVKLSHKQLQRLTQAERAEYARNHGKHKSKHRR